MDKSTKTILFALGGFILGAAAGGTGMYFYSKRYFQAKSDEEIQNMTEYYISKYESNEEDKKDDEGIKEESNEEEQTSEKTYSEKPNLFNNRVDSGAEPRSYTNYYTSDDSSSDIPAGNRSNKKKKKQQIDIEVVDNSVWDDNPGLATEFLTYFDADDVLVNEETEAVLDDNSGYGHIHKMIANHSDDCPDDILIIQDNTSGILYHVTVERMSYQEQIVDD